MSPEPDRSATAPIRRLRVVPNPSAALPASDRGVVSASATIRIGGRHRKPDPDDEGDVEVSEVPEAATDVVPAQRAAGLATPPRGA